MTTPKPWSHSALDDFVNCPRSYYEKRIAKSVTEERSEQMIWGEEVHKAFELRQLNGKKVSPLPEALQIHEPFMQRLKAMPGMRWTEQKVGFNRKAEPCDFFAEDVWCRLIIDYKKVHENFAVIVDYKTGKPHNKFKQLKLCALHTFADHPDVDTVSVMYYWTKTQTTTMENYTRDQIPELWAPFVPDLRQYAQAFKEDVWQPRPSGLCNGWCPVKDCEFWKPKRNK